MPNEVVESGDLDANYFQHLPYLEQYNEEKGSHLVSVGGIHYEPFGIYPGTKSSLDDVADGDSVAVPNEDVYKRQWKACYTVWDFSVQRMSWNIWVGSRLQRNTGKERKV